MTRYIRWQGLVAFLVLVGLIFGFTFLVLDSMVEQGIESAGTNANGAKVELASVDLTLFPLGLTLKGLQVTDREAPMTNLLEVERIAFLLDAGALLKRKLIVDEMAMEGLAFKTARTRSGAVTEDIKEQGGPATAPGGQGKEAPAKQAKPDVKQILANEDLETLRLAGELEGRIGEMSSKWEDKLSALPTSKDLDQYKARLSEATKGKVTLKNFEQRADALKALEKDINKDLKAIKSIEADYKADKQELDKGFGKLKAAPARDVKALKEKYGLSGQAASNLSGLLFGEKIEHWVDLALRYYETARPYMEKYRAGRESAHKRGKGITVLFKERDPLPDFMIRRAAASVRLEGGVIDGEILHITHQQDISGRPTTLAFSTDTLKNMSMLSLTGSVDRRDPETSLDVFDLEASGMKISGVELSGGSRLPVTMERAGLDIKSHVSINNGELDGRVVAGFRDVNMEVGDTSGSLAKVLAKTIRSLRRFKIEAGFKGPLTSPDISIRSDMDKALAQAAGDAAEQEAREFQKELEAGISEYTSAQVQGAKDSMAALKEIQDRISSAKNSLDASKKETSDSLKDSLDASKKEAADSLKNIIKLPF